MKIIIIDHMNQWYMPNPEFVPQNDTHKLHRDFEIQTDHIIAGWRPDLTIIYKIAIMGFNVQVDHRVELKECEKRDKYLDLVRKLKILWNMKVTIISIVIGALSTVIKRMEEGPED